MADSVTTAGGSGGTPSAPRPTGGMRALTLATVFAAASGYIVMLFASRALGPEQYPLFAAYWSAFFALTGIANGLMQEGTRAIRSAQAHPSTPRAAAHDGQPTRGAVRILPAGLLMGLGFAALVVVSWPAWPTLGLPTLSGAGVGLLALGIAGFSAQAAVAAALSGTERWRTYAVLLTIDAGLRLAVGVGAWLVGAGIAGFVLTTVVGAATWLLLLATSADVRAALTARLDVGARRFWSNTANAMTASAGTAVLVVGFLLLVTATARADDDPVLLGAVVLVIPLTRAPLLVPLTSFQSAIIVYFVRQSARGLRALAAPLGLVAGVGVVGGAAAWVLGPWILRVVFGEGFVLDGPVVAGLTVASVGTAALMVTGCASLARSQHGLYACGWWVAAIASAVLLVTLPWSLDIRATVALLAGPAAGIAVHVFGLSGTPGRHALVRG